MRINVKKPNRVVINFFINKSQVAIDIDTSQKSFLSMQKVIVESQIKRPLHKNGNAKFCL